MKIFFSVSFICLTVFAFGQKSRHIVLDLSDSVSYSPYIGYTEPLHVFKKWKNSAGAIDSILWTTVIQPDLVLLKNFRQHVIDSAKFINTIKQYHIDTAKIKCSYTDTSLQILQYRHHNKLYVSMLKRYNGYLKKDITLTYDLDSIEKHMNDKGLNQVIQTALIDYNFCYNNKNFINTINIALIPFKGFIKYNDEDLDKNYLIISKNKSRFIKIGSSTLSFYQNRIGFHFENDNLKVKVFEDGILHMDKIDNGKHYKATYYVGDTIILKEHSIILDSISLDGNRIFLQEIIDPIIFNQRLPEPILADLKPYFSLQSEYLIMDFWGTWCAPCIKMLPRLKTLQESLNKTGTLVSVLYDKPEKISLADKIFKSNGLKWRQIFNNMDVFTNKSITDFMKISIFPSYVIIKSDGQIILQDSGEQGFNHLVALLKQLKVL